MAVDIILICTAAFYFNSQFFLAMSSVTVATPKLGK